MKRLFFHKQIYYIKHLGSRGSGETFFSISFPQVRFYWSMRVPNKRCRYVCSIHDVAGRPEFRVLVQEPCQDDLELRDTTPRAVWARILEPLATLRKEMGGVQVFPRYISGEDLFGLTEPAVVRVLESLPGMSELRLEGTKERSG